MLDINDYYFEFMKKMGATAGCRFAAYRRLSRKDMISAYTISWLSLIVITLSMFPYFLPENVLGQLELIPLISIVTSIFIIIITLLEASQKYNARAESMHQCGKALNELYYELEYLINSQKIDLDKFYDVKKSYDVIINNFPENHEDIDFHVSRMSKGKYFGGSKYIYYFKVVLWYWYEMYFVYAVMVSSALLAIVFDFYY